MLGINFFKADPSTHALLFKNGKVLKQGAGQSFFYYGPSSSIVAVPVNSKELPFFFQLSTQDFQEVSIQGQVTFQIVNIAAAVSSVNFSVNAKGEYLSDDPESISERVVRAIQVAVKSQIEAIGLRQLLIQSSAITEKLAIALTDNNALKAIGIEIKDIAITNITPSSDTSKALEAEVREGLLRQADDAIYARRLASIEKEKSVKESELDTEKALQKKHQDLERERLDAQREQMKQKFQLEQERIAAKIEDEVKGKELVALQAQNERLLADAKAYAIQKEMEAYKTLDDERLRILMMAKLGPEQLIAQAFENLTKGKNKVGNLNISPDLLQSLIGTSANASRGFETPTSLEEST
jgi:regulator of protease activity HflC (stomatin/prohibitin superfamily)